MQINRRRFGSLALLGGADLLLRGGSTLPAQRKLNSTFGGIPAGCDSYSFRDRDLEEALVMISDVGFGTVELWYDHFEFGYGGRSERKSRQELRQWRLSAPLDEFEGAAKLAAEKGMEYSAYNFAFTDDVTDSEVDPVFEMTQALGAKMVTGIANPAVVARIDAQAKKHRMRVGIKNSSSGGESNIVTADDIQAARRGASDYIAVALDIGDLTAANGDPVSFVEQHHGDIVSLYLKDRKKDNGPVVPFGQGDTPMQEVLRLLREKGSSIPVNVRYEYDGEDTFRETREGYRYCQGVLA